MQIIGAHESLISSAPGLRAAVFAMVVYLPMKKWNDSKDDA
jgi:biopolymer transport protein ExbB/TolQ